jgi:MFS family permease
MTANRSEDSSLLGVNLVMFLSYAGFSSAQFHSYLFESLGFRDLRIGFLLAAGYGAGILSPLLQVIFIRVFHGPRLPLMAALALGGISLACLPHARGYYGLMALFFAFCFSAAAISPLNTACTLETIRKRGREVFFRIRTLGTIGFLIGCVISACFPMRADLPILYLGFGAAMILALVMVAGHYRHIPPEQAPEDFLVHPHPKTAPTFRAALRLLGSPHAWRMLSVLGVLSFANAMASIVQGNYLIQRWQGGQLSISLAWVVSTACEIPIMLLCVRILKRRGLNHVLGFGLIGTLIKLVVLAFAGTLWSYFLGLSLHGCFFAGVVTGFGIFLDHHFHKEDRPTLQALSAVFLLGLPSAMAGLATGLIWHFFSLRAVYAFSGLVAALGAALGVLFFFIFPAVSTFSAEAAE